MRTTKVKRLWPVMALAPLLALAAVLAVSLWHSGPAPGGLTPPAAEAQGRDIDSPMPGGAGNTCTVATIANDYRCISNEDTLTVTFNATNVIDGDGIAVYVTGASGEPEGRTQGPHRVYANIQAVGAGTPAVKLGKKGIGSYFLQRTGIVGNTIDVKRSWADDKGRVWALVHQDASSPSVSENTLHGTTAWGTTEHAMVEIFFTQSIDTTQSDTIVNLGDDDLPAKEETEGTPTEREISIADVEGEGTSDVVGSIRFNVNPKAEIDSTPTYLGGRIIVSHEFTAGSALKDDVEMTGTFTHPPADATVAPPSLADAMIPATEATGVPLTGWETTGAVELTVNVTHVSGPGERTVFDPFVLYREGPADEITFTETGGMPENPHRTTSDGTSYEGIGPLEINDVLGRTASGDPNVIYEGGNAAAMAILPDDEEDRMISYSDATSAMFGITIKDTATTGAYPVNFVVKGPEDDDGMRETLATLGVTVNVIGAPDAMAGTVDSNLVNPGGNVELTGVALTSGGENSFDPPCEGSTAGTSICEWSAKDRAAQDALASRTGTVDVDGTKSIMVKSTALPGTYTIVLSDARTGVPLATPKDVSFTVRGRPAMYTLTGPVVDGSMVNQIPAGKIAAFTVMATDANGNTPYFPTGENTEAVSIVISGDSASVTPLRLTDGQVRLDATGTASFQIRVNNNAPSGSITVDAVGLGDGLASQTVAIGPLTLGAPTGLTLQTLADDTGTVTLSWTAGANSTRHFIAGIKQEDWDANNFDDVLWTASDSQTEHTFTGLEGGKEYVFTVTAGNAAGQWSDWFLPLRKIVVGTPAPTGGGNPISPFMR